MKKDKEVKSDEESIKESDSEKTEPKTSEPAAVEASEFDPQTGAGPVALGAKARAMRDALRSEPKVKVFIPLANGEKQGVAQSVILNGYTMYIRKGGYVEVPESVAEVLEVKLKHKANVENHPSRIGGDRDVKLTSYGN